MAMCSFLALLRDHAAEHGVRAGVPSASQHQQRRTWKESTGFALASVGLLTTGDEKDGGVEAEGRLRGGGRGEGISFWSGRHEHNEASLV
jgi:hypothetical protein